MWADNLKERKLCSLAKWLTIVSFLALVSRRNLPAIKALLWQDRDSWGAEKMAQLVKCWLGRHDDLSLDVCYPRKSQQRHVSHEPCPGEAETGRSLDTHWPSSSVNGLQCSEALSQTSKVVSDRGWHLLACSCSTYAHASTQTCTCSICAHMHTCSILAHAPTQMSTWTTYPDLKK